MGGRSHRGDNRRGERTLHDAQPVARRVNLRVWRSWSCDERIGGLTWIPGVAVGANVITGYILYQVMKCFLVARLLALAERPVHGRGEQAGGRGRVHAVGRTNEGSTRIGPGSGGRVLLVGWTASDCFWYRRMSWWLAQVEPCRGIGCFVEGLVPAGAGTLLRMTVAGGAPSA